MNPRIDTAGLRGLFTRIAGRYDALNRALTFGIDVWWRRRALACLAPPRTARDLATGTVAPRDALDLATGTADLAIGLARRFPAARVTGLDLTPAMLEIGRRKVAAAGLAARIDLREGDAQALPFADAAFDVVTCAFGFRNFPDKARALAEAARALRPGGTLLVLEFFRPRPGVLSALTAGWLRLAAALLARGARAEYAYLRTSIAHTLSVDEFAALAARAGFTVERRTFHWPSCHCLVLRK